MRVRGCFQETGDVRVQTMNVAAIARSGLGLVWRDRLPENVLDVEGSGFHTPGFDIRFVFRGDIGVAEFGVGVSFAAVVVGRAWPSVPFAIAKKLVALFRQQRVEKAPVYFCCVFVLVKSDKTVIVRKQAG